MLYENKDKLKSIIPKPLWNTIRVAWYYRDLYACARYVLEHHDTLSRREKLSLVSNLYKISFNVQGPHFQEEILNFYDEILALPAVSRGVVVEAGCFKGCSTAKFSLAAAQKGKELVVFDSFQGIPENQEEHGKNIYGSEAHFAEGDYCGMLEEVKNNVTTWGAIDCCRFIEGWFEDTLPHFDEPIAAIYLDVDLVSSTATCLKYLYPLLEPGGVLISQDGHLPLVINLFEDESFWLKEVGYPKPTVKRIKNTKLLKIMKGL